MCSAYNSKLSAILKCFLSALANNHLELRGLRDYTDSEVSKLLRKWLKIPLASPG